MGAGLVKLSYHQIILLLSFYCSSFLNIPTFLCHYAYDIIHMLFVLTTCYITLVLYQFYITLVLCFLMYLYPYIPYCLTTNHQWFLLNVPFQYISPITLPHHQPPWIPLNGHSHTVTLQYIKEFPEPMWTSHAGRLQGQDAEQSQY